ncbi:MAG: serine hydrolase [Paenisporosarcina sp.]
MKHIIQKLKEIDSPDVGILVYSIKEQRIISSLNSEMTVPLASAAKLAIAFCVANWVKEEFIKWSDIIEGIKLNPNEDSHILYPHLQGRDSLSIYEAVEVMIACHDSFVANGIVEFCGGWDKVNLKIKSYFPDIHITENPRDIGNQGVVNQLLEILCLISVGYEKEPYIWAPIMNGLVSQQDEILGIPNHLVNHMTGGLEQVIIDMGFIGELHRNPLLFVLAAKNLPNRSENKEADLVIMETMNLLYSAYLNQQKINCIL